MPSCQRYLGISRYRSAKLYIGRISPPCEIADGSVRPQFDWLCALQHYGLPTRLLDWTESLAVALYFTIRLWGTPIIAPTIWVLDPFRLYQLSIPGHEIIPTANHFTAIANADIAFSDNSEETAKDVTDLAIPVLPDFIFDRLAAQNGCFTIHGRSERLLEDMLTSSVTRILHKFVARRDKLSNIFESLDVYIPSPDALFPDLEGIKDYII